jgi:hypothetical protein
MCCCVFDTHDNPDATQESNLSFCLIGADGEAANAQVCKTYIRGFDSRSALQIQSWAFVFTRAHWLLLILHQSLRDEISICGVNLHGQSTVGFQY